MSGLVGGGGGGGRGEGCSPNVNDISIAQFQLNQMCTMSSMRIATLLDKDTKV